jgi:hypothetical protein
MRPTLRFLIGCAAGATGAALLRTLTREPRPLASCRLANGTIFRLLAVTRGPIHRFKSGPRWQRLLAQTPFLRALAGEPVREIRGAMPDSLIFWITQGVTTLGMLPNTRFRYIGYSCEVVNELGCSYCPDIRDPYPPNTILTSRDVLTCWEAVAAPRRGRQIGLRLRTSSGTCNLMTPNPWPGPYSVWKAEPLPSTKRAGDLAVTLTSVSTGVEVLHQGSGFPLNPVLSQAHLRLVWKGQPSADWLPIGATLRDPTGNLLVPTVNGVARHDDQQAVDFQDAFCADELIWKLRLELVPCTLASIAPVDLWTLPSLPLPPDGVFSRATAQFSQHGTTVHLRGIAGPGAEVPADDNLGGGASVTLPSTPGLYGAYMKCTPPVPGVRLLLIRAVDDRGRSIHPLGNPGRLVYPFATIGPVLGDRDGGFTLQVTPGTESVTLVFALVKSRFVEFVVRPSRAPDVPEYVDMLAE